MLLTSALLAARPMPSYNEAKVVACHIDFRFLKTRTLHCSLSTTFAMILACNPGCRLHLPEIALPGQEVVIHDQLVVHSDFHVPTKHRLLDELTARRGDISERLKLPTSDEPIHVFLFKKGEEFRSYMNREHPEFPDRRAFFIKNDTTLTVLAYWGESVGDDLRHEVTHGYLHSVVPNLPLWLDEGVAEYFETPRGNHGMNPAHVYQLSTAFRRGQWEPDLVRLEALEDPATMTQEDYAESWLWVHFLIESSEHRKLLQDQLARLRMAAESEPLSTHIQRDIENPNEKIIAYLKQLAEEL